MLRPEDTRFGALWALAEEIPGWLTKDQARALYEGVRAARPGATVVEIGSHQGRSTIVLAGARDDVDVIAIDPHEAGGRFGGRATGDRFRENLRRAGVSQRVRHLPLRSQDAYAGWSVPVDLLYVDGKHDYWSVRRDLRWVSHLRPEGAVFVHDVLGSFGVTCALLADLVSSRSVGFVARWGSLARFTVGAPTVAQGRAFLAGLPWFARNLLVKATLRTRLRSVTRLLGHHDLDDPY